MRISDWSSDVCSSDLDGWWIRRRVSDGRLMIRTDKFPSARVKGDPSLRPLTDRLHAMGFKGGIYSDLGRKICSQAYDRKSVEKGKSVSVSVDLGGRRIIKINMVYTQNDQ